MGCKFFKAPRCPSGEPRARCVYLDGGGGDLDVVQAPQGAVPVDEVGGCQLVQRLQRHRRAVGAHLAAFRPLAQLPFVHKNGEGLLSWAGRQKQQQESATGSAEETFPTPSAQNVFISKVN